MGCQLIHFGGRPGQGTFQAKPKQRGGEKKKTKYTRHSSQERGLQDLLGMVFNHWSSTTSHTGRSAREWAQHLEATVFSSQLHLNDLALLKKSTVMYIFYTKGTYLKWIFILTGNNTIIFYNFYAFNP